MKRRPWEISRRAVLRGAGAALALPWLDAMLPVGRRALAAAPPKRFFAFFVPNGMRMDAWTPATTGSGFGLPAILGPLASVRNKVQVLTGLANRPAISDGNGDHARGTASFLTCRSIVRSEGADVRNGISMDQVLANALDGATLIPSLQLGAEGGSGIGDCDNGYSCAYVRNISWAGDTTPLAKEVNPLSAFDRLIQGDSQSVVKTERGFARRRRVLDLVAEDAAALRAKLGRSDQLKLDEYTAGVHALDQRIEHLASAPTCAATRPLAPENFANRVQLMLDIVVLAFRCDLTRVATFMLANSASNVGYEFLGITDGHHQLSHHQGNPDNLSKLQTIGIWEVQQLAYVLRELDTIPEGTGTLLDQCAVLFASEIEDGDAHRHTNLPVILAGRAGGTLGTGQHVRYDDAPPLANLYVALLNALGVATSAFGDDGTAPLAGIGA